MLAFSPPTPHASRHFPGSWPGDSCIRGALTDTVQEQIRALPGALGRDAVDGVAQAGFHSGSLSLAVGPAVGPLVPALLLAAEAAREQMDLPAPFCIALTPPPPGFQEDPRVLCTPLSPATLLPCLPLPPTLVVLDLQASPPTVQSTLESLRTLLAPGTPVLCHRGATTTLLQRACEEGWLVPVVTAEELLLLRAGAPCSGRPPARPPDLELETFRARVLALGTAADPADLRRASAGLRLWMQARGSREHALGLWPHAASPAPLPRARPDGSPWPRISLVTPSFQHGHFIEQTILSVQRQGYPDVEHLIVDGGSTDDTDAVVRSHLASGMVYLREPDRGQTHALNKGFARATGEILTWLNSDDLLAPGALAAAALAFAHPEADVVAGTCVLQRDGEVIHEHLTSAGDGPLSLERLLDLENCWQRGEFFYQPEVFFRREIWERAGGRLREDCVYSMDYELWLRLARHGARLRVLGRPLAQFRLHGAQKTADAGRYREEMAGLRRDFLEHSGVAWSPPRPQRMRNTLRVAVIHGGADGSPEAACIAACLSRAGHKVARCTAASAADAAEVPRLLREQRAHLAVLAGFPPGETLAELAAALVDRHETVGLGAAPSPALGALWKRSERLTLVALGTAAALRAGLAAHGCTDVERRAGSLGHFCDTRQVRPRSRRTCRELLGLPLDRLLILVPELAAVPGTVDLPVPHEVLELGAAGGSLPTLALDSSQALERALLLAAADLWLTPETAALSSWSSVEAAAAGLPALHAGDADALHELSLDPRRREEAGTLQRLQAESAASLEAAYHGIVQCLRRSGVADRVGLGRQIRFLPQELAASSPAAGSRTRGPADAGAERRRLQKLLGSRWRQIGAVLGLTRRHPWESDYRSS